MLSITTQFHLLAQIGLVGCGYWKVQRCLDRFPAPLPQEVRRGTCLSVAAHQTHGQPLKKPGCGDTPLFSSVPGHDPAKPFYRKNCAWVPGTKALRSNREKDLEKEQRSASHQHGNPLTAFNSPGSPLPMHYIAHLLHHCVVLHLLLLRNVAHLLHHPLVVPNCIEFYTAPHTYCTAMHESPTCLTMSSFSVSSSYITLPTSPNTSSS